MAETIYDLIVNVSEEGFNGMTDSIENLIEFVGEKDELDAQGLYDAVKDDIDNAPDDYREATTDVLDTTIDKVLTTEGELDLTYSEGVVMGLYIVMDTLNDIQEDPFASMMLGFKGGLEKKLESVYRDRTEAAIS